MSTERNDDLAGLPDELEPPAALEDRVVAALNERRLLRTRSGWRTFTRVALAAAASVALVGAGVLMGQSGSAGALLTGAERDLYALLLFENDGYDAPRGAEARARYNEYGRWVGLAASRGQFVAGQDLEVHRGWVVAPDAGGAVIADGSALPGTAPLSGVFFIRADNPEQALELARELPHLRHGGKVVVQKTIPTDAPPAPDDPVLTRPARPGPTNAEASMSIQVHYWSAGVAAMHGFYTGLGFEEAYREGADELTFCILRRGDAQIMIGRAQPPDPPDRHDRAVWTEVNGRVGQPGPMSVYFLVPDLDAVHAAALDLGANILEPLWDAPWGQRQFTVRDPDGNLATFVGVRPS